MQVAGTIRRPTGAHHAYSNSCRLGGDCIGQYWRGSAKRTVAGRHYRHGAHRNSRTGTACRRASPVASRLRDRSAVAPAAADDGNLQCGVRDSLGLECGASHAGTSGLRASSDAGAAARSTTSCAGCGHVPAVAQDRRRPRPGKMVVFHAATSTAWSARSTRATHAATYAAGRCTEWPEDSSGRAASGSANPGSVKGPAYAQLVAKHRGQLVANVLTPNHSITTSSAKFFKLIAPWVAS